uniref:Putative secreted protein n=1 Tax=Anopheles marajoara TaxID=58244 RepID=A0A2M4C6Z7_9DIPT
MGWCCSVRISCTFICLCFSPCFSPAFSSSWPSVCWRGRPNRRPICVVPGVATWSKCSTWPNVLSVVLIFPLMRRVCRVSMVRLASHHRPPSIDVVVAVIEDRSMVVLRQRSLPCNTSSSNSSCCCSNSNIIIFCSNQMWHRLHWNQLPIIMPPLERCLCDCRGSKSHK